LDNYFSPLKIKEETEDKRGVVATYGNIGNVYVKIDDYPEALKNYSIALKKMAEQYDYLDPATNNYNNIGVLYGKQGNYSEALKNFSAALSLAKKIKNKRVVVSIHSNQLYYFPKMANKKALQ